MSYPEGGKIGPRTKAAIDASQPEVIQITEELHNGFLWLLEQLPTNGVAQWLAELEPGSIMLIEAPRKRRVDN